MPDIFLYAGEVSPNDVKLSDPTVVRSGTVTVVFCKTKSVIGTKSGSKQSYE